MALVLVRRIAFGVIAVLASASLAFVLAWHAPGGPAVGLLGEHAAAGQVEELTARLGLDRPAIESGSAGWVACCRATSACRGGEQVPVASLILERLPLTLALTTAAAVLAAVAGTLIGVAASAIAARWPVAALAALHAVPSYVVAQGLVLVFALALGWLPVQGIVDAREPATGSVALLVETLRHLALPVAALALHQLCFTALLVRAAVREQMQLPHVTAAMARGRSRSGARWHHALPNAALPVVTLTAARIGGLVGGAVVIETAFALPGLGRLAVTAAVARDHPVVIGCVVAACALVWLANLLADAIAPLIDPRLRAS